MNVHSRNTPLRMNAASPSSNLDVAVGSLTKTQYSLLQRIDQLTSELERTASPPQSGHDLGVYAAKLGSARERIVAASSTLKTLKAKISKVCASAHPLPSALS